MPHRKPNPRCIFCGEKADSREHAIPKWMAKQLELRGMLTGITKDLDDALRHPISTASHRGRILCKDCNKHFGLLEEAVIAVLVPMAQGHELDLDADDQALLALWAGKTGIALLATTAPELLEVIPMDHRRSIREGGVLNDEMWIGYFPWSGPTILHGGQVTLANDDMERTDWYQGYSSIFAFRQVGFKLVGLQGPLHGGDTLSATNLAPISQLWPIYRERLPWPEGTPLTEDRHLTIIVGLAPISRGS